MSERTACLTTSTQLNIGKADEWKVTYIDRLNAFYRQIVYDNIPPHAQLVYLHLLNVNNQLKWQEEFRITDRRLETLTGLSKKAITDAKRILNGRFVTIDTKKENPRQGSSYSLLNLLPSTETKNEGKIGGKNEGKIGGKNEGKIGGKNEGKPLIYNSISITKIKEGEGDTDDADARVCVTGTGKLSEDIIAAWGETPNWNDAYDLRALEEHYGTEAVVKSINAAKNSLKGETLTTPYLRGTLRRIKNRRKENVSKQNFKADESRKARGLRRDYDRAFGLNEED